ncbi:ABC transporter ATP-binding protein [Pseudomonas matsuisoli]|uniref:ABC transporter ATP-binding protein n=1 Tax=Pseudomonas matsuisoli TaxID=1515666 RepID=A0A917PPV8_9PSED|nr:ABC transporter ATP-binding protein [Pseudomonas matsuisoli]GGJ86943.1 ABC transporter ATP-binding protein [Pseudomonas matsuisoli]
MLLDLLFAGRELAGYHDPRIRRGLLWATAEAVCAFLPYPLLYLLLADLLLARADPTRTGWIALALLATLLLRMLCARQAMPALFGGAYAMMGQARLRVADHLRRLPLGWLQTQRNGHLSAVLANDLQVVEDLWSHSLGVFFGGLLVPVLLSGFLLWVDWRLGLLVLACLPIAVLMLLSSQRILVTQGNKLAVASAQANADLLEHIQGLNVLRSLGQADASRRQLADSLETLRRAAIRIDVWPAPLVGLFGFAVEIGFALLLWFGVQRLAAGQTDASTLLLFAVLALPVYRQLFEVGLAFLLLRFAHQSLLRIRGLLAVPALPEPATSQLPTSHDIRFEQVRFTYAGASKPALDDLDLTLPANSLTALVGPSGAGKTTLMHLIARLWDVDSGHIRIGGVDLRTLGSDGLQQQIAMVFQDVQLFNVSVLENLRIGRPDASRETVEHAARLAQAHAFIERLPQGYDTLLDENGSNLSGGERQRLSIARALLKDAPIVLLDEATASVDPSAERLIQQALAELVKGRTVLVIAHRLHSIQHADRILVLEDGRLVEEGRHTELLQRNGRYTRLWQQMGKDLPARADGAAAS